MAANRRYTWRWHPLVQRHPLLEDKAARAVAELDVQCLAFPQHYRDPEVTGTLYGFVEIRLTVSAKDHWRIPWRVRTRLLPVLRAAMGLRAGELEEVGWDRLEPHHHQNRAARWRGKQGDVKAPDP